MTKNEFIEKARKVHGDKYDYSKVEIEKTADKIIIICPRHGEFEQVANSHLQGRGCAMCSGKKFSLQDYIEKANKIWNNKYDYSKFEWKGINQKVCIICPEHGEFWQLPNNHLKGECGCLECRGKSKNFKAITGIEDLKRISKEKFNDKFDFSKSVWKGSREKIEIICPKHGSFWTLPRQFTLNMCGCPKCGNVKYTNVDFIKECEKIHKNKNYDYSKVKYIKSTEPIIIICKKHGEFYPIASSFLNGKIHCPECTREKLRLGTEEFISRARQIHGNYYDYSKVEYKNCDSKVTIICPKHGEFDQYVTAHLKGCNCPICARENMIPSKGGELISKLLDSINVKYKTQYKITLDKIARSSNVIYIDFIFKINNRIYAIEYNGKQHYKYIPFFHANGYIDYEKQLRRDEVLREYCKDKNIILIEIKYNLTENEVRKLLCDTFANNKITNILENKYVQ